MKHTRMIIKVIAAIILVLILMPFAAFLVLHYFILTPEILTAKITQEINNRTLLAFQCEKIELNYLDSWPSVSLTIKDGKLSVPALPADSADTLLAMKFKKISGKIQLVKFFKEQTLCVEDIFIDKADAHLELGKPLPRILKKEGSAKSKKQKQIYFDIHQINIPDVTVHAVHKEKGIEMDVQNVALIIKGDLAGPKPMFDVEASCPSLTGKGKANLLGQTLSVSLQGHCEMTDNFQHILLKDAGFQINQFPFKLNGSIRNLAKNKVPEVDMQFSLSASQLQELLEFIPDHLLPEKKAYILTGSTALEGKIKGEVGDSLIPDIHLKGFVSQGSFYKKGIKQGIDTISLNMELCYKSQKPDSCYIALHNVKVKGLDSYLQMESRISNLQEVPFINVDLKGDINFDRIGAEFISPQLITLKGELISDVSLAFNLHDLQKGNLNKIWADGILQAKHIEARSTRYKLDTFVSGMDMKIGYKKNRSDFIAQDEVLSGTADIDTFKMAYDQSVYLNLSQLHLRSNTALSKEVNAATPVTLHLDCNSFQAKLDKNKWVSAEEAEIHAGTKASLRHKNRNEGAVVLKANTFKYLDAYEQSALVLHKGEFVTELRPSNAQASRSLKDWDIKGVLNFEKSQLYSPYFPLMVNLNQTRLSFQNNQLVLNRVQMQSGKSDCTLSGIIHTHSQTPASPTQLEGTFQLLSGNIDYDELKQTFLYGEALQKERPANSIEALTLDNMEQKLKHSPHKGQIQEKALYLPKNVQLDIQVDINNMNYHEIGLQQVRGNIFIKQQKAYSKLSTRTNLGKVDLGMLYDSQRKDQVKAYFDLDLKDVLVAQMHKVIPTVTTMLPLTESMDGLIDCRLTAEGLLDNQMLPILASTQAVCSLKGQQLILIDNATFDEIARKFKFKNKKRNVIDKLETHLVLQDNQIEVIPFLMEWDRYKAIIGGTHSTDFTYNYHLDMLKSPIPIDFGVNLSGKSSDFHYKISKCKYKSLYKDGGVKHNEQVKQRLDKKRQEIIKQINL